MSVRTGNLLYTAGHLPISLDGKLTTGKVRIAMPREGEIKAFLVSTHST